MSQPTKHRKCGFCGGSMPSSYTECPYCQKSLEGFGVVGAFVEGVLPKEMPVTKILIVFMVGLYVLIGLLAGGTAMIAPAGYSLIHFGANFPPYVATGQWWRLITAMFMHRGILHIGFNLYYAYRLGTIIERSFGKSRYLMIAILTGLASTLASFGLAYAWWYMGDTSRIMISSVGFSGAVTGFLGAGVAAGHMTGNEAGKQLRNRFLKFMGFIAVFGLVVPGIDNAAHFGGFLAGVALGAVLPLANRASKRAGYAFAAGTGLLTLLVVVGFVLQGLNMPRDMPADLQEFPTAIFGKTIRKGDPDLPTVNEAAEKCRALRKTVLEGDQHDPALRKLAQRDRHFCTEAHHYAPRYAEPIRALIVVDGLLHREERCTWIALALLYRDQFKDQEEQLRRIQRAQKCD